MKGKAAIVVTAAILLICGGVVPVTAEEGYYRWTDQYGNVQLSDRPPPTGIKYEFIASGGGLSRIRSAPGAEPAAAAAAGTPAAGTPAAGTPAATPAKAEAAPSSAAPAAVAEAPKNLEYCEQARANLQTLSTSARIRLRDSEGEYRYLSAEEKESQRANAADMIKLHCE